MNYLLDAHTLIWVILEPDKLSHKVLSIIEDPSNEIFVSAVTFWEISLKFSLKKLDLEGIDPEKLSKLAEEIGFTQLSLLPYEAASYYNINATWHRDPFDRMLIWQAIKNDLILLSKDKTIAQYQNEGLKVLW